MRLLLEHFAVAVSAVTGVLGARGKRLDLFGVMVLALVTAVGGGTLRDLCLGVTPVFWIESPAYLTTALVAAVVSFVAVRLRELPLAWLLVADAFGLALFTIIGTEKAVSHGAAPSACLVLGVMTGVAGGILRDVLRGEIPLVFRSEIYLYATAAFVGALAYLILRRWTPGSPVNRELAMALILALRLAAIQWRLRLPEYKESGERHGGPDMRSAH